MAGTVSVGQGVRMSVMAKADSTFAAPEFSGYGDVEYARNISLKGDISIIIQTVKSVLNHSDIVEPGILEDFDEYRKKQLSGEHSDSYDRIFNRK